MRLVSVTLSPPVRPVWTLTPQPFHTAHLDTWILLPSGGDRLVWHSCLWRFHTSPTLVQHNPLSTSPTSSTPCTQKRTLLLLQNHSICLLFPHPGTVLYILSMCLVQHNPMSLLGGKSWQLYTASSSAVTSELLPGREAQVAKHRSDTCL